MLAEQLKKSPIPKRPTEPLWKGPSAEGPSGGITQSMLQRFVCCRERFRIKYVLGLEPTTGWSKPLGYGDMWHICEEAVAMGKDFRPALADHLLEMFDQYPYERETIEHFVTACLVQFPCYQRYWREHPDQDQRIPISSEEEFDLWYHLPSGRKVRLRGKKDSVDYIPHGINAGIWLQENKTKGDVDEANLRRQLTFDCQTMFYLVSLFQEFQEKTPADWVKIREDLRKKSGLALPSDVQLGGAIRGVRYNVVKRPFSGGRGTISQKQPTKSNPKGESVDEFWARLKRDYFEADPGYWFMRWNAFVSPQEVRRFQEEFLDPTLEQLCDWYEWIALCMKNNWSIWGSLRGPSGNRLPQNLHWRAPFGVYDPLKETGATEYDSFIATGSEAGLSYKVKLFPELAQAS